jgi:hypothetical protein
MTISQSASEARLGMLFRKRNCARSLMTLPATHMLLRPAFVPVGNVPQTRIPILSPGMNLMTSPRTSAFCWRVSFGIFICNLIRYTVFGYAKSAEP